MTKVNIIGGGLAGSEAAWQLAKRGYDVEIFEMRQGDKKTFAHQTSNLAELVCSNSFRSDEVKTAVGLLHEEMRQLDSLIIRAADANKLPAGSALAVDRDEFSKFVEAELEKTGKVKISRGEINEIPLNDGQHWIIATGPLTSDALSKSIIEHTKQENLAFFDAIAPIVFKESINFDVAWMQSRYDKVGPEGNGKDYVNCPLNKEQYEEFISDLITGDKTDFKEWEKSTPYFDGCLPIEVMADRGPETLRYGPMKPVGLTNPHIKVDKNDDQEFSKDRPGKSYAIVQLRQDNKLDTLYNIVGFQTKLKYGEQERIFRKIPGLENAQFARLGGIHRNTFLNSPILLDESLRLKTSPNIRFAGQITGVEGYVESSAMGLLTGIFTAREIENKSFTKPKTTTSIGALLNHITLGHKSEDDESKALFQPMNTNFGLFEPLEEKVKKDQRKEAYSKRALEDLKKWRDSL